MASVCHHMNEDNEHPTKHDVIQPKQGSSMIIAPPASETHSSLRVQHHVHRSYLTNIRTTRATIPFRSQYHPPYHLFAELHLILKSVDDIHQWAHTDKQSVDHHSDRGFIPTSAYAALNIVIVWRIIVIPSSKTIIRSSYIAHANSTPQHSTNRLHPRTRINTIGFFRQTVGSKK
ncbi:AAEL004499-PA [Aedes aegypti]|uniref:AAEL004499-PA n=1 Tax=Aedes aegypti TaxID=7159 RepID=Q0IFP4_AEDAE|nr:AAEL004499-PA [Aedes aegypti]